jgi:hypothetical protein
MSGQRNKKPDDIVMKRQEYLDNLNLEIELQDANERAVRTYKETGQMPVSTQMKDNRTVEDKLRDVEKIKASIREDMALIADSRLTDSIIQLIQNSPFNQDGNLLIFFAQRAPDIVKNLQKSYKFGIRGDQNDAEQFVSFVIKFYTDKNNLNSSTKQFMSRLGTTSKQGLSRKINEQAEILTRLETEMKRIVVHVKNTLPAKIERISLLPFKKNIVSKADYLVKMITLIKEIYPANLLYTDSELKLNGNAFKADLQDFENIFNDRFIIEFGRGTRADQQIFDLFFNYINKNIPNLDYVNTMITKLQKQSDILIKRPDEINRISFIDALDNLDTVINTGENIEYIQNVKKAKDAILKYIYDLVVSGQYTRVNTIKYDYPLVPTSGVPTSGVPTSGVPTAEFPTPEFPSLEFADTEVTPDEYEPMELLPIPPKPTDEKTYLYAAAVTLYNIIVKNRNKIKRDLNKEETKKIIDSYIEKRDIIKDYEKFGIVRESIPEDLFKSSMRQKIIKEFNRIVAIESGAASGTSDDTSAATVPTATAATTVTPTATAATTTASIKPRFNSTDMKDKDEDSYIKAFVKYLLALRQYYKVDKKLPLDTINELILNEYNNVSKINHLDKLGTLGITPTSKTTQQISNLIGGYYQHALKKIPAGSGLRKTSKIQGTGFPQPAYNFTKQKVEPTQGIQSDPRYIKFGRYLVNTKSLKDNKLSLRREKGTPIASLPVYKMSHPFGNVMKKIVGGALPTAEDFSQLTDDEKRYLHKVSKEADLSHKMEIPTPSKDEEEKDVHLFNVYKGEIMAGNDSKEMIKKFKLLMIKLVNNRSLDKRDVSEIMQMLTEAGY